MRSTKSERRTRWVAAFRGAKGWLGSALAFGKGRHPDAIRNTRIRGVSFTGTMPVPRNGETPSPRETNDEPRATSHERRNTKNGFTLVELLVALSVTSIILGAVAALAFAATSANDATNESARVNTELRTATLRLTELLSRAKLIAGTPSGDTVVWAHDNGDAAGYGAGNNQINAAEVVFMEVHSNKINLVTYTPTAWTVDWFRTSTFSIWLLKTGWAEYLMSTYGNRNELVILPRAANITCSLDTLPPYTRRIEISFDLQTDGIDHTHKITAYLRSHAGHLLDAAGEIAADDD